MSDLNDKIIQAIEQMWQYNLPKEYRKHLLENDLDKYSNYHFNFHHQDNGSYISSFFEIKKDFNNNLLLKQKYSGIRVPENCLPIASDCCGNLILLSVKGSDRNKIYFWEHEMEVEDGEIPDYSNLTLIADSFDEFINSLKNEDEVEL